MSTAQQAADPHQIWRQAAQLVARADRVPVRDVLRPRGWPAKRRRMQALYLAHVAGGLSIRRVAHAAGVAWSSAHAAVQAIEDRRDDAELDRTLTALEERLVP
jgi:hypothetical protein